MDFREYRKQHRLTQAQLAARLGLDRSVLSQYERGTRHARSETLEKLRQQLGVGLVEPERARFSPGDLKRYFPDPRPERLAAPRSAAWSRLGEHHPELLDFLGTPPPMLEAWIRADSTFECLAWLQLHRAGANLCFESPVLKGCPGPPLCLDGRALGTTHLPCLFQPNPSLPYLCWPQVEMRTAWKSYRVDALMLARVAGRTVWTILELDGPGHRSDLDERRTESLGMKVMRFNSSHIYGLEFTERLTRRLQHEFRC